MGLLFLSLFLAVAATAHASGYEYDRLYRYRYHGYLYTGFTGLKSQHSGLAFDSDVVLRRHAGYYVLQLENVRYDKFNSEIEDFDDHSRYEYRHLPSLTEHLTKPVRVHFKDSEIEYYEVFPDDVVWSLNVKRGILALFNLNFDGRPNYYQQQGEHYSHYHSRYYNLYEDGVGGECETSYIVQSQPYYQTPNNNNVMNVTKTRDYHRCTRQPYREYVGKYGYQCVHCESEKTHNFHARPSRYHYSIRGSRQNYVIEKVVTDSEAIYAPYTARGQTAYVYLNRTLQLVDEDQTRHGEDLVIKEGDLVRYHSLAYRYENRQREGRVVDLKRPHYLYDVYGYQVSVEQVGRLLHELATEDTVSDKEESKTSKEPGGFVELVRAFSTLDYNSIDQVYRRYVYRAREGTSSEDIRYLESIEQLFISTLAATGSNPSFAYAKHLIENRNVAKNSIKHYLHAAPSHFKEPTETLLDEAYRLCEHTSIRNDHQLRTAAYLGFSDLVHETCVATRKRIHHYDERENRCTPEKASRYFNYLIPSHRYEDDHEQILYIRTAGNFGLKETIDYVKHYLVNGERYPLYYRISALWALTRVSKLYSDEVLKLVVPLYFDESQDHEIRIAAFTIMMITEPPSYYLETVANSLYHEPNDQVLSYVYSTFYYLANSTHPCHRKISKQARAYLEQLNALKKEFHPSLDHSFNFYSSGYDEKHDVGGLTHLAYIASNSSYVPRSIYLRLNNYFGGESQESISFGYHAFGLDRYFDRIFGPKGPYRDSSIFERFGRRSPRDVDTVQKELKELEDKLKIATREYEPVYGDFFISQHGAQISLFQFNESIFEYILNSEHHGSEDEEKHNRFYMNLHLLGSDRLLVVPTDLGFPMLFDIKQPVHLRYDSKELKVSCDKNKNRIIPTRIEAKVDGHMLTNHETYVTLGVAIPFERTTYGVGVHRRSTLSLPINMEASLDLEKVKFNFKYNPVTPHTIYHLEFEPFTYIDSYDNRQAVRDEDGYIALYDREHLETFEREYFKDYLGVGLKVKTQHQELWNDYGSWYEFLTNTDLHQKVFYYNPHFHPYSVDICLTPSERDRTEQIEGDFKYDYYGIADSESYKSEHLSEGLENYGRTGSDSKWRTHVITGDLYARGQLERHVKTELTYSYTYDYLYHKYHIYYERTPFHSSEKGPFKLCFSGIWNYPRYDYKKFYSAEIMDHTVTVSHNLNFGKDCKTDKKVTVSERFQRTEEQKDHELRRDEPVTYDHFNEYAYYYQKCNEEKQRGFYYNSYCRYYFYLITKLNDYQIEVTYENLPESFRNLTHKIASHVKHLYYHHVDYDSYAVNPDGMVRVEFNVSLHDPIADVRIRKPHETTHYNRIYLRRFRPISSLPSPYYSYFQEYVSLYDYPYCVVQGNHVRTFDNLTYTRQSTDCYDIVAKDCSPKKDFIVLGKKITHQRYEKAVKIFLDKYKVEMLPVSEDADVIVRVNGKRVTVVADEPYYHYVTEGEKRSTLFFVSYNGLFYTFHSHSYGLTVDYSGKVIIVQSSPYYRGKLCGLCGDYNSDKHNELRGPEDCVYHDATTFGYSYAVKEDGCSVPDYKASCVEKRDQQCVQHRNRYLSTGSDRNKKICFTTTSVPKCTSECRPTKLVTRKLAFHCLPAKEGFTKHLQRESEFRVLDEIKNKSEDYETELQYPEDCYAPKE